MTLRFRSAYIRVIQRRDSLCRLLLFRQRTEGHPFGRPSVKSTSVLSYLLTGRFISERQAGYYGSRSRQLGCADGA